MDNQPNQLHVDLQNPQSGWIDFAVSTGDQMFEAAVSSTTNDFLLELATALSLVMQGGEGTAVASCEPVTYELMFSSPSEVNSAQLQIFQYPDWKRTAKSATVVLSVRSTTRVLVLPFWNSLRRLERQFSAPEYRARMQRDFPTACLQRLSQLMVMS